MKIYKYKDYEDYVERQIFYNKEKVGRFVFVKRGGIAELKQMFPSADSILCHGTRDGTEQRLFKEFYPDAEVIGTEISDNAEQFPMTVQWDFSKPRDEWVGKFDLVYSNSLDHTITPEETIRTWGDQLSERGMLVMEWSKRKEGGGVESDPFAATVDEVLSICNEVGFKAKAVQSRRAKENGIYIVCRKL